MIKYFAEEYFFFVISLKFVLMFFNNNKKDSEDRQHFWRSGSKLQSFINATWRA